jgi:predicted class III extradiol MEMO1 family dioxygenase
MEALLICKHLNYHRKWNGNMNICQNIAELSKFLQRTKMAWQYEHNLAIKIQVLQEKLQVQWTNH